MPPGYRIGSLRRKRGDGSTYRHYQIIWDDERGPHRVSLGTDDRQAAEAAARAFWSRRTLAATDTVGEIMEAWLTATVGERGHKRASEAWKAAKPFWHRLRPGLVDAAVCRSYAVQRSRAANTVRNEISAIRAGLKWAKVKLAEPLWMPPMPDSEVEHLTKAQFKRFMAGCSAPHVRLFAALAVGTGARSTALRELRWERVDLERRTIDLNPRGRVQLGNKRRAVVKINDQLAAILADAKAGALTEYVIEYQGGPIASIRKGFEAASARSKVRCTPHMLRHSACIWMLEAGEPIYKVSQFLGHKNSVITERVYGRFAPDFLGSAAKALTW